jgi:hypothetical protein
MLKLLPISIFLCFGILGCKDVKPNDITGTWIVKNESRHRFLSEVQQKAAAKIILDANGTFIALEIPEDLLYGPPQTSDGIVTGNGIWKILLLEGKQQVQLNFESITVGQRGVVPYGTQLNVSRGWSTINLFYFQGDPDEGKRIEFEELGTYMKV